MQPPKPFFVHGKLAYNIEKIVVDCLQPRLNSCCWCSSIKNRRLPIDLSLRLEPPVFDETAPATAV